MTLAPEAAAAAEIKMLIRTLHKSQNDINNKKNDLAHELMLIGAKYLKTNHPKKKVKARRFLEQAYALYAQCPVSLVKMRRMNTPSVKFCEMKQYSEAEKCLTQALSMYTDLSEGADSVDIADILCNLTVCYLHRGNKQAAIEKFTKACDIYMKVNPTNPHVTIIHKYLSVTSECKEKVDVDGAKRKGESDNNENGTKYRKLSQ